MFKILASMTLMNLFSLGIYLCLISWVVSFLHICYWCPRLSRNLEKSIYLYMYKMKQEFNTIFYFVNCCRDLGFVIIFISIILFLIEKII